MCALAGAMMAELSEYDLDVLAERLAPRLAVRLAPASEPDPWLNTRQAAEHLAARSAAFTISCSPSIQPPGP